MKISVVIPIHNEADNLEALLAELTAALERMDAEYEVILINDGSEDGSGEILTEMAERVDRVRVIHLLRNYGQTSAMMAGFDHARGDVDRKSVV